MDNSFVFASPVNANKFEGSMPNPAKEGWTAPAISVGAASEGAMVTVADDEATEAAAVVVVAAMTEETS